MERNTRTGAGICLPIDVQGLSSIVPLPNCGLRVGVKLASVACDTGLLNQGGRRRYKGAALAQRPSCWDSLKRARLGVTDMFSE